MASRVHESRGMTTQLSEQEKRDRLNELMESFETAMLVTRTVDGELRSRPLAIARKRADGGLYFATAIDSPKVIELETDPHVNVAMQSSSRFVSVSGHARISRERALIDELWSESWKVWFPKGKDDPALAIVIVEPMEASYWDASGATGLKYLFESAKAYLSGTQPASDDDERHTANVRL